MRKVLRCASSPMTPPPPPPPPPPHTYQPWCFLPSGVGSYAALAAGDGRPTTWSGPVRRWRAWFAVIAEKPGSRRAIRGNLQSSIIRSSRKVSPSSGPVQSRVSIYSSLSGAGL